jgi:hypothetical protein
MCILSAMATGIGKLLIHNSYTQTERVPLPLERGWGEALVKVFVEKRRNFGVILYLFINIAAAILSLLFHQKNSSLE